MAENVPLDPLIQEWLSGEFRQKLFGEAIAKTEPVVARCSQFTGPAMSRRINSWGRIIKNGLLNLSVRSRHEKTILCDSYFEWNRTTALKMGFEKTQWPVRHISRPDPKLRGVLEEKFNRLFAQPAVMIAETVAELFQIEIAPEPLTEIFARLCKIAVPLSLCEEYAGYMGQVRPVYSSPKIKGVITGVGYYTSEHLLYGICIARERGIPVIGSQHGGGTYGAFQCQSGLAEVEGMLPDYFLSWGMAAWDKAYVPQPHTRLVKAPSLKLKRCRDLADQKASGRSYVLYMTNFNHSFSPHFGISYIHIELAARHAELSGRLINALEAEPKVIFKCSHEDSHLDTLAVRKRFINHPNIEYYGPQDKAINLYNDAKLVIFDHLHTGFLEAMASNYPSMGWVEKPISYAYQEAFEEHLLEMRKVGIISYSVEEFLQNYRNIIGDVDAWWQDERLQKVVADFVAAYAYVGDDPVRELQETIADCIDNHKMHENQAR